MQTTNLAFILSQVILWVSVVGCSSEKQPPELPPKPPPPITHATLFGTDNPERRADVVFVHGLGGSGSTTWECSVTPSFSWPAELAKKYPDVGIWSITYAASPTEWLGTSMPIEDRSQNLLTLLHAKRIGQRPLIFIAHSLGGLVVKQMIRDAQGMNHKEWTQILENTKGVVFLATPHQGSELAMATYLHAIAKIAGFTVSVEQLQPHSSMLRNLNTWYRNNVEPLRLATKVYYENQKYFGITVVDPTTADPGIAGSNPIALDANHVTIAKPCSDQEIVYLDVCDFIEKILAPPPRTDVKFEQFWSDFEAAKKLATTGDRSKLYAMVQAYGGQLATWEAIVIGVVPDPAGPSLKIVPSGVVSTTSYVRANFRLSNFTEAQTMPPETKVVIEGEISKDSNILGAMLDECKIVRRVN